MEIIPPILAVILLVFLNGFFVASEFALVTARKTRIDELVKQGNKSAKLVQKAIKSLDTFISATQLGITIASLGLGWVGEPAIARLIEPILNKFLTNGISTISAHAISIAVAFSLITFLHIVLGELAPKSIALQKAEITSLLIIRPLGLFAAVFKPFIFILNGAGILVLKVVGFKAPSRHSLVHSEEEIKIILAESAQEGAIEREEAEMVYSVLRLGDTAVSKIMVPRSRIIAFERDTPLKNIIKVSQEHPHSRFPVYEETIDRIVGFVHVKDIYRNLFSQGRLETLKELYLSFLIKNRDKRLSGMGVIREIPKISEMTKIDDAMILLRERRVHMAVVRDENKRTVGIITLEDLVESLVGDIHDEFEEIQKTSEGTIQKLKSLLKN